MDPSSPWPRSGAAPPPSELRRLALLFTLIGAAAAVAFVLQLGAGVQNAFVVLGINLGLAAGAFGFLLLLEPRLREAGEPGILQFVGFVAIALLGRVWLGQTAQGFAILFEYSLSLGALAVAIASGSFRLLCTRFAPGRAALTNGLLGAAAFLLVAIGLLATSPTRDGAHLLLLGLTCVIVSVLLGIQWWFGTRSTWEPSQFWATSLGLALAGTQLFDGVLTYLVVVDPLGIAPDGFEEQIPVSRFILEWFGIGFPIAKWALGLFVALILAKARFRWSTTRVVLYLAILAAGMGPGLYSAAQLF